MAMECWDTEGGWPTWRVRLELPVGSKPPPFPPLLLHHLPSSSLFSPLLSLPAPSSLPPLLFPTTSPAGKQVYDESGELVCTKPFPSMPTHFWNDEDGIKYTKAYFSVFQGEPVLPNQPGLKC